MRPVTPQRGADPGRRRGRRSPPRSTSPTRGRAAAVPARGAALPQGRPDLVVRRRATRTCATGSGTPCAGSTCAAPGRRPATPPTSTRPRSSADLVEVIAWLAAQEWCNGSVGMFGTSYSGFNSLQIACERAAGAGGGLRDLRHRRPVDRRRALARRRAAAGRPGRLLPLHDPDVRAAARARGVGRRLGGGVAAPAGDQRALGADLAARGPHGDYWRGGSVRLGRRRHGLRADRRARRCWSPAGPTATATTPSAPWPRSPRTACRTGCWPARGRTPTRAPRCPGRGSTSTSRWRPGSTAGCATVRRRRRVRRRTATSSSAPPPGPSPTSTCTRATGCGCRPCRPPGRSRSTLAGPRSLPVRPRHRHRRPGSTAPGTCRGACPATSASTTPAP